MAGFAACNLAAGRVAATRGPGSRRWALPASRSSPSPAVVVSLFTTNRSRTCCRLGHQLGRPYVLRNMIFVSPERNRILAGGRLVHVHPSLLLDPLIAPLS